MQYPKMLCKGTQAEYEYQIAQDAEHESKLRKDGFVDYPELPLDAEVSEIDQPETNLEDLTADELRGLLNEKGVEFKARDSKGTLIELILNHDASKTTTNQD